MTPELTVIGKDGKVNKIKLDPYTANRIAGNILRDVSHNLTGNYGDGEQLAYKRNKLARKMISVADALSPRET